MQCYYHCEEICDLLNEHIDKIGLMAYRPGYRPPAIRGVTPTAR